MTLFWTDLETTGLDPSQDQILEIAVIVTDDDLSQIATFHALIVSRKPLRMTKEVWQMHTDNGLLAELEAAYVAPVTRMTSGGHTQAVGGSIKKQGTEWSMTGTELTADTLLVEFIERYAPAAPMAGSSIGFDRGFYKHHLPDAETRLHYRNFDVSVYREAVKRWVSWDELPSKNIEHRAMTDIQASLQVAKHWKESLQVYEKLVEAQAPGAIP